MRDRSISFLAFGTLLVGCPNTEVVVGASSSQTGTDTAGSDTETDGDGDGGDVVDDHRTYFIGESTKFDGGGQCAGDDLNTITSSLRKALDKEGWTGLRFVDDDAWPEDFQEGSFSNLSLDESFGDAARLSVYAGHGDVGMLQWGRPSDNGACRTTINVDSRLGRLAGDTAATIMLMTSCTMRADQLWPVFNQQASRHFLGYHDSPHIGYDEARKVFARCQDGQSTADAWLEEMVFNGGGKTSPIVFTMGTSLDDAADMHDATNLASGQGLLENVGEPAKFFFFELFDSGCTVSCGNCSGNVVPLPKLTLAGPLPRLTLARPVRSATDLTQHVGMLLERFDVGPLDDGAQARLGGWADAIVDRGDVTYAQILDDPRIDLSYDPASDMLRITNRDALSRARPGPHTVVDDPPELRDALRVQAQAVLAELQNVPGMLDWLDTEFDVTTRVVGYGSADNPESEPIAFEYMFTLPGRVDGLALPDRSVEIGITRLGELSTLAVAMVEVEIVGSVALQRSSQQALTALESTVLAQYPAALAIEYIAPKVGYQLAEGERSLDAVPSLLVGYVLQFGATNDQVVSRRVPVRISLSASDPVIESLAMLDPNPDPGDSRDSN